MQKQKTMIYYVSVARRTRRSSEADITLKNFADRKLEKLPVLKKIEKISKNDLQKQKTVIYYVSVARLVRVS